MCEIDYVASKPNFPIRHSGEELAPYPDTGPEAMSLDPSDKCPSLSFRPQGGI